MSFTKLHTTKKIKLNDITLEICKFKKDGTNRTFWSVNKDGKRFTATMYARLYDCERACKSYLKKNA